jgi:hypothetical protein
MAAHNRAPCRYCSAVDEITEPLEQFIFGLETVFHEDWGMTRDCLSGPNPLISAKGTFLYPNVEDQSDNWGNRGGFLHRYRAVKRAFRAAGYVVTDYGCEHKQAGLTAGRTHSDSTESIRILCPNCSIDDVLADAIGIFLAQLEVVLHERWHQSRRRLANEARSVGDDGTFLYPDVDDEFLDWEDRGLLLASYRRVKRKLLAAGYEVELYGCEPEESEGPSLRL